MQRRSWFGLDTPHDAREWHSIAIKVLQGVTSACSQTELFNEALVQQAQALGANPSMDDLRTIANTLLERALYVAKKCGRDRVMTEADVSYM
jgi:hypothetical protein